MQVNEFDITPVPKPRMTKSDKWKKRPETARYWAFKDEVRLRGLTLPECGYHVIFTVPMPKSWSKKKRAAMNGQPHQQRPDKDNFEKALLDAVFGEDCRVWDGRASKLWGESGKITVRLPEKSTIHELITIS
ncbi:RusA family crossover junction endodeoxyribonuclease [Morganella morganii]|uniref:RusA family crossover junction endodeoxyribonuclease n=1 Tax=Morganella morganii TaxID=582 RepID=UPI001BDB7C56|nr:RusA family crossover junction endodeoxyribonuclease [Morganella morganii]MBT0460587.1 RusA family crossover junction endodeoxyribonuclease [Morganella morganii subsp. morganii]